MAVEDFLLQHARVSGKRHRRVTLDDKMTFFQQLASLTAAGVPLLRALQISAQQTQSSRLQQILQEVAGRVAAGCTLNKAMASHENVFEEHWIALINTGEVTGNMDVVLHDLNSQIRESQDTRRKISGALTYPLVLLAVAVLVVIVMLWFVVPTFADMFAEMNAELPGVTLFVIAASDLVSRYGLHVVAGLALIGFAGRRYVRTEPGRRKISAVLLATPLLGDLTVQSAMYRFSSNLALLLRSGVPMLDTLHALKGLFKTNPAYRDAILVAQNHVAAGRSLADSLVESGIFTALMTNMIHIGEESAQLANVMAEIAPYYKDKMNAFLARATKLLEPCIILVMGFIIAVVMLAIYIPMFEMSGKVN